MADCTKTEIFFEELNRLTQGCLICCEDCPLCECNNSTQENCFVFIMRHYNEATNIVQKWSDENPQMTLLEYLKKLLPNVRIGYDGTPSMCPSDLGLEPEVFCTYNCKKCWNRPYEEFRRKNIDE